VTTEVVVLVDAAGRPTGTADKATVHTVDTPLHLAFSCYLDDGAGRVLLTRRALAKRTWPGVWTNACCGHPGPGEPAADAVVRRTRQELGCAVTDLQPVLPDFRYRAVDAAGVVENEVCPVFSATLVGELVPEPAEVAETTWVRWPALVAMAVGAPAVLSPWSVLQVTALDAAGWRPPGA
jgi:isopentenyl-diphosphate delta-isomerase